MAYKRDCVCCGVPLSGGVDTFGSGDAEVCMTCWFELIEGDRASELTALSLVGIVAGLTDTEEFEI